MRSCDDLLALKDDDCFRDYSLFPGLDEGQEQVTWRV